MGNSPVPINEPLDYRGTFKITSPLWVMFFQNIFDTALKVSAGANYNTATVNVSTVLDGNHYFVKATGAITITLPNAIFFPGKQYIIKKIGAGVLTIALTAGQTVDGASSLTIDQPNVALAVESDGANWNII